MTILVSSTYTIDPPEVDGRCWVKEVHVTDDNLEYDYTYLCDLQITDPQMVLDARVAIINVTLIKRANALSAVVGTSVPITRYEFLSRFTTTERIAIRQAATTDPIVYDFMDLLSQSGSVTHSNAIQGLGYLASTGVITSDRVAVIGDF